MTYDIRAALQDEQKALVFAGHMIDGYLTPAFGARSKSEIDLLMLGALIEAGAIDPAGPIYDLARTFNITPTRARSLLLNWQLRDRRFRDDLSLSLREALQRTRFSKDGTLLTFGVESPLLKEEIVARLKRNGFFADSTFARDIVRMPVDAFVSFLDELVETGVKKEFEQKLVKDKQLVDKSFKALAAGALGKLGEKIADETGKEIASGAVDFAKPFAERFSRFLVGLLKGNAGEAVQAVDV